ncbi:MAG: ThuA domain-containing protein [Planctomycetia bacterium]|nr:ThuA domain-containing protein [Planctomycetia bacterium]
MKNHKLLFWITLSFFTTAFLQAAEQEPPAGEKPIRVLVVTGGHSYNQPEFDKFLASFPELEIDQARLPEDRARIAPGLEKEFDVLLLYDQDNSPLSDEQKQNFVDLLNEGIGLFALHHHLSAHQDWEEHFDLIGGRDFFQKDVNLFRGKEYPRSTFIDDVDINIDIADSNHPITRGVKPFTIHDEAYGRCPVHPDVHVLLSSTHPDVQQTVAYTWHYGKSPVFVNMLGHGPSAWKQPEFAQIFIQGIRWLRDNRP